MSDKRIRDYHITIGELPCGPRNAITDVPGVTVGHCTIDTPEHQTGVTADSIMQPQPQYPQYGQPYAQPQYQPEYTAYNPENNNPQA